MSLQLLAPVTPFITDFVYGSLYSKNGESIHSMTFPSAKLTTYVDQEKPGEVTKRIVEFNSKVWNEKRAAGLSLNEEMKSEVPAELEKFGKYLRAMHKIKD